MHPSEPQSPQGSEVVEPTSPPEVSREELITMVARSHQDPSVPYAATVLTGKTLAAQSKLPRVIAENLGAGFGQWTFFPEPTAIVDFARGYVPPSTEEDLWVMARVWAEDDATGRPTMMSLVGREILQAEMRRIEVPKLRALLDENNAVRARALREALGLDVPPVRTSPAPAKRKPKAPAAAKAPVVAKGPVVDSVPVMAKMPVVRRPPMPIKPVAPPKRFAHPKFGEGPLERHEGEGPDAKLTIKFASGSKTLLARFLTECPSEGTQ